MLKTALYVARRGLARLRRSLLPIRQVRPEPDVVPYPTWIARRLKDRQEAYPAVDRPGLFSLITPVFDPPSGFFRVLGKSILAQDHTDWQWVIVDNGCKHPDVLYLMNHFARDPRVTLVKADGPRGIIGGMRLALEHARNEYVLPVDHDDRLYPDALRVIAACLQARDFPAIAYTDEDKLLPDGSIGLPSFKPDWDPLLFLNACYIAHQGVMNRKLAWQLGLYTDPQAEGTPDGDSFCRFIGAGHEPVHIPEIVYSWRMHAQSTALLGVDAKPYVTSNQKHVLTNHLGRCGLRSTVSIRTNPLPGNAGCWRVQATAKPVPLLLIPAGDAKHRRVLRHRLQACPNISEVIRVRSKEKLLETLSSYGPDNWLVLLAENVLPATVNFVEEWMSVVQACPAAVLAGGTMHDQEQRIISAGLAWGMNGLIDSPFADCHVKDYSTGQGHLCLQRCVTSVDARFCMITAGFLRVSLEQSGCDIEDPLLPAWWGAMAEQMQSRVVYSPFVKALVQDVRLGREIEDAARFRFLSEHGHRLAHDRYYSRYFGLTKETSFQPVQPECRFHTLRSSLCALADNQPAIREWMGTQGEYGCFLDDPRLANFPEASRRSA
jgi:hypothetical protein